MGQHNTWANDQSVILDDPFPWQTWGEMGKT